MATLPPPLRQWWLKFSSPAEPAMSLCGQGSPVRTVWVLITRRRRELGWKHARESSCISSVPRLPPARDPSPLPAEPRNDAAPRLLLVPAPALLPQAPAACQGWGLLCGDQTRPCLKFGRADCDCTDTDQCCRVIFVVSGICRGAAGSALCQEASRRARPQVARAPWVLGDMVPAPPGICRKYQYHRHCCDTNEEGRFANHPSA